MALQTASEGQVVKSAAEVYDDFFVPALFGQFAGPICELGGIATGDTVLDVACGTGATTRAAAERAGPGGRVTGLDMNPGMLDVARRRSPEIDWREGRAEALPFDDGAFDTVLCQFALMFFRDRALALREMARVVRTGGRIAVSVWDHPGNSPGYAAMIALLEEMFGDDAANALRAPFVLGDLQEFRGVLASGGLTNAKITTVPGTARFASIPDWVRTEIKGWTLADVIDDDGCAALIAAGETRLTGFLDDTGVAFPAPAHIAVFDRA